MTATPGECYWESLGNGLVFLEIRLTGRDGIRVVPGRRSQVDDRRACIRLSLDADEIAGAPCCDSGGELDASMERAACEHFRGGCKPEACSRG